jgi:hypothetical protein
MVFSCIVLFSPKLLELELYFLLSITRTLIFCGVKAIKFTFCFIITI